MTDQEKAGGSFWASLPGVLTALATLITALVGAYALFRGPAEPPQSPPGQGSPSRTEQKLPVQGSPSGTRPSERPHNEPATPPSSRFRIVELHLRADPFRHDGPCPVKIRFSGRISVAGGGGTVAYRFLRSDGASAPVQSVDFARPGSQNVETTWQLGGDYSGWQQILVLDPAEQRSEQANFTVHCR